MGGFIDVTTGGSKFAPIHEGIFLLDLKTDVNLNRVSLSSDGNGSVPKFNNAGELQGFGSASCKSNIKVIKDLIDHKILPMEKVIALMTKNVAKFLNFHKKGEIKIGNDADFVVFDNEMNIKDVIAKGEFCMQNGEIIKKGFFE